MVLLHGQKSCTVLLGTSVLQYMYRTLRTMEGSGFGRGPVDVEEVLGLGGGLGERG
jgi:hypothetical protein